MKEIPKSITVTVERNGNCVTVGRECSSVSHNEMKKFRFYPRTKRYRVTYTLDPKGELIVIYTSYCADVRPYKHKDKVEFVNTCFLPTSWHGLRVSRKVMPIRVKK